jgi:general secretion pathway protein D
MTRFMLILLTSGACFVACTVPPVAIADAPSPTAEQTAREELARRQESQLAAERLITQGEKLSSVGDDAGAAAKLEEAVRILPRAPVTDSDYGRAVHDLAGSYVRLANASFHEGDNAKAHQFAQKALDYDPNNRNAEDIIIKVKRVEAGVKVGVNGNEPSGVKLDETPEFDAKKDQIKRLFREGKILMNSGQYDEAERRFQQILLLDPYNEDASALLKSLNKERVAVAEGAQDATRVHRLWEVSDSWVPPISLEVQANKVESPTGPIGREAVRQQEITKKLNDIIIPEINYREAVVSDVITFLSDESRRLDPAKIGVNIVLSSGVAAPSVTATPVPAAPTPPGPPGAAAEAAAAAQAAAGGTEGLEGRKITLSLRNVPLIDALKYVTTLADLKFRVESSAVIVLPKDAPTGDFVTRSYPVNPGAFKPIAINAAGGAAAAGALGGAGAAGGAAAGGASYRPIGEGVNTSVGVGDVKALFTEAGVPFPPGSSLVYNDRTSTIIIRNTPENIETFEQVLSTYNFTPSQIEIEAKFVQINQTDLDELGFTWNVGTKQFGSFDATGGASPEAFPPGTGPNTSGGTPYELTSGLQGVSSIQGNAIDSLLAANGFGSVVTPQDQIATIRGILTNPQFQVVINALSQKQSADTLSAPKVTTISGNQAQVRVVQEFIYPTSFEPPQVQTAGGGVNGNGAVGITPSTPGGFKTREVGVLLNVTPQVGADGYTINLTLAPEVSQFLGFINYGGPISLAAGNNVVTTFNDIKQPLFSSENLTTSVIIWDGQTVVLGGLITEQLTKIDDKVPFLGDLPMVGRLFRSKVTQRNKLNLLIFVTARLIRPDGSPVHHGSLTASAR